MASTIITKYGSGAPLASDLVRGELAVDTELGRLYTETSGGAVIEIGLNPAADVTFADNAKAVFGTDSDLQIYHVGGSASYVETATNDLYLKGFRDVYLQASGANSLTAIGGGATTLMHNGSAKLSTTATGIDVTGTVTTTGSVGIGTASPAELLHIESGTNGEQVDIRFRGLTTSAGAGRSANIGFDPDPNDTGTSSEAQLYLSADTTNKTLVATAAGNVGIGTASPGVRLHVEGATDSNVMIVNNIGTAPNYIFDVRDDGVSKFRVDPFGNVHIGAGTASTANLSIITSGQAGGIQLNRNTSSQPTSGQSLGSYAFKGVDSANSNATAEAMIEAVAAETHSGSNAATNMIFYTKASGTGPGSSPTPRMTLNASGNLLVGTTDTTPWDNSTATSADDGIFLGGGRLGLAKWGGVPLLVNRTDSDGDIAIFYKDGGAVGSIGSNSGDSLFIQNSSASGCGLLFHNSAFLMPARSGAVIDNVINLGRSDQRFKDAYIVNGVTTGSDGNDKQDIETLSDAEQRVAVVCKGLLRKWRWKDAVEAKGDEARIHFGIIAQDLQAAFEAEGLDAGDYAMFMSNTWTDEETGEERTRLGVRYHELLAFIIAAI